MCNCWWSFQAPFDRAQIILGLIQRGRLCWYPSAERLALEQVLARVSWISARSSADCALFMRVIADDVVVCACTGVGGFDHEQRLAPW